MSENTGEQMVLAHFRQSGGPVLGSIWGHFWNHFWDPSFQNLIKIQPISKELDCNLIDLILLCLYI